MGSYKGLRESEARGPPIVNSIVAAARQCNLDSDIPELPSEDVDCKTLDLDTRDLIVGKVSVPPIHPPTHPPTHPPISSLPAHPYLILLHPPTHPPTHSLFPYNRSTKRSWRSSPVSSLAASTLWVSHPPLKKLWLPL